MEEKKKRGCNYTAEERDVVLELVKKYHEVIENKETNAHMISKKRQAWESVCQQYNVVAVSGTRTWHQLRHLYENLKQRSKKNIAKENRLQFYEKMKEAQRKAAMEKKEVDCSDGLPYESSITERDNQMLAMVVPQIQPLINPFENTFYYGDSDNCSNTSQSNGDSPPKTIITNITIPDSKVDQKKSIEDTTANSSKSCSVTSGSVNDLREPIVVIDESEVKEKPILNPTKRRLKIPPAKPMGKVKYNTIYQQYLMTKLKNAKLETKYLMNRNRMEMNKYRLEVQILKLRLGKLKSTRRN